MPKFRFFLFFGISKFSILTKKLYKTIKKNEFSSRVRFFGFLSTKKIFTSILTPSTEISRFWVFFQKTMFQVKIIDLEKFRLYRVSSEVTTYVRKSFYPEISEWKKVSNQAKKKWKSANLSKCTLSEKSPFNQLVIKVEPIILQIFKWYF